MINDVYVFGDSYSTPGFCVAEKDSFWFLASKDVGAKNIYQYSYTGCAFESIQHIITCLFLEESNIGRDFSDSLFLIGIPPLVRIMYYDEYANNGKFDNPELSKFIKEYHVKDDGELYTDENEILSHKGLSSVGLHNDVLDSNKNDLRLTMYNHNYTEIQTLRYMRMLEVMLKYYNVKYYMFINLSKPIARPTGGEDWPPKKYLSDYFYKNNHSIVFNNTYQSINQGIYKPVDFDEHGWQGHHGSDGNRYFYYNSLKGKLQQCNCLK